MKSQSLQKTSHPMLLHTDNRMLFIAIAISLCLHTALLMLNFGFKNKIKMPALSSTLEVVLVNARSATQPKDAKLLGQANLDNGGNTDEKVQAKTPLPALHESRAAQEVTVATKKVEQLEQEARKLITQVRPSKSNVDQADSQNPARPEQQQDVPNAEELVHKSLELARLEAQIAKEWKNYQERPRRRYIGGRVKEYRFAAYEEDWRAKVERIGTLNYPSAAKDQKITGSVRVTVSIRADGSVESVEINRSSGSKILDSAAIRTVNLAEPFSPFPPEIRKDTDILSITRTWNYTVDNQLVTGSE